MSRQAAGFTMIEVLVSLLILGFGIMGAAAMQLTALRTAQHSAHQTAALRLAIELADSMRAARHAAPGANPPSSPDPNPHSDRDNPYLAIDFGPGFEASGTSPGSLNCYAASCNASAAIEAHIRDWLSRLSDALPAARARVCRDDKPWNSQMDRYTWDCIAGSRPEMSAVVIKIGWRKKPEPGADVPSALKNTDSPPALVMPVALSTR